MNIKKFAWYVVVLALLQPAISRRKSKGKCYGQYTCQRPTVSGGSSKCICINQSQFCNGATDCPNGEDEQNCDRTWANWVNWNDCSRSCGGGHRVRYRTCNPGKGSDCIGKAADVANCAQQDCPVNGGWTSWPAWGDCDKTCGGGMRTRVRTCTRPPQSGGGSNCMGNATEQTSCAMNGCPEDGGWTEWMDCPCTGASSSCPRKRRKRQAEDGTKTRYRFCNNPIPSNGGAYCDGDHKETDVPCVVEFGACAGDLVPI